MTICKKTTSQLPFKERANLSLNSCAKKLFTLMEEKQSTLCVAADCTSTDELLNLIEQIGSEICLLKTHIDILSDFHPSFIADLQKIAAESNFLIFEDRKFADIGTTVQHQYCGGVYHIADWAHLINAHITPGPGIIRALQQGAPNRERALLLLAQMSSKENLFDQNITKKAVEWAQLHSDFVIGFIAQERITFSPQFLHLTPGVHIESSSDVLGQQYRTPEIAVASGTDIIIVGRGISQSPSPKQAAKEYRQRAWDAYLKHS